MASDRPKTAPADPSRAIRDRYTGDSRLSYHESRFAIPDAAYPWVARLRARKIAPQVSTTNTVVEFDVKGRPVANRYALVPVATVPARA